MDKLEFRLKDKRFLKKLEQTLSETVVHRRLFRVQDGVWPFVVFGPDSHGNTVVRGGKAEQSRIHRLPVYIATLGGPHVPDSEGVPIEELASGDLPPELEGMKIFHLTPLRPLEVSNKRTIARADGGVAEEIMDFYKGNDVALIETPDEAYWALSVLKYLDENDRNFPSPVLADFYSKLGVGPKNHYIN
jgi:hypothetical protein